MLAKSVEYKRFVWELSHIFKNCNVNNNLIFLCIGTKSVVGDSFGPTVGTYLKNNLGMHDNVIVVGDLEKNIIYDNIEQNILMINENYKDNLVIAIDSALSSKNDVGKVFIQNRGLKYGESLSKKNRVIGNVSIKAVVGTDAQNSLKNFSALRNASVNSVTKMCNLVSKGIVEAYEDVTVYWKPTKL